MRYGFRYTTDLDRKSRCLLPSPPEDTEMAEASAANENPNEMDVDPAASEHPGEMDVDT